MVTYYYGWESLAEWAYEVYGSYGLVPASASFNGIGFLRGAVVSVNQNVEQIFNIGTTTLRKPDIAVKGVNDITGSLTMWLPDDLDATALDCWMLKLGLDAYNVAHDGTKFVIPNTGTSAYGSHVLPHFTLEIGHNKSGAIRMHQLIGCMINTMTVRASSGEKVEVVFDFAAKNIKMDQTSFTNGSGTRSTSPPMSWANCQVEYGDDGSSVPITDATGIEIVFNNNLVPNRALAESSVTIDACDVVTGWTESTDAIAVATNTTTYKEGGTSLSLGKDGSASDDAYYDKTITATDMSGKKLLVWVYIADATTLTALDVSAAGNNYIMLGTGGTTNTNIYNMGTGLAVGWNQIICDIESADSTGGTGADETLIDSLRIALKTDAVGDTFTSGKVIMDYWRLIEPRSVNNFISGRQDISGTLTINLTTTTGIAMYDALCNDASAPWTPDVDVKKKQIKLKIVNNAAPSTQYVEFDLREVIIGEIPTDFNPEKHTELTVPFTAKYYACNIATPDTTAPTSWHDTS